MYRPQSLKIKNIISHVNSEYMFKNGVAIIVVGINHDDSSQKGNGSGKSALIESLALAYTGTSIRDVKVKELVNRQAKDGEVELIQYNSKTKLTMKIWRKVYTGTKPTECKIWIYNHLTDLDLSEKDFDEKCQIKRADINDYNKFVFEEIGLSREDFFNFFLLVDENYEPFLRVGDVKKKEIINRFSGADSVDQLIPLVKDDCIIPQSKVTQIQDALKEEETRFKIYEEDIVALNLKNETLDETKTAQIEEVNVKIRAIQDEILTLTQSIESNNSIVKDQEKQLTTLDKVAKQTAITTKINTLKEQKQKLIDENTVFAVKISEVQKDFKVEIDAVKTLEDNTNAKIVALRKDIKDFEELESEINKQIQDSVECPKCQHKFSIRSVEFNHAEAILQIPVIVQELKDMKDELDKLSLIIDKTVHSTKQDINRRILEKQNTIKENVSKNNVNIVKFDSEIATQQALMTQLNSAEVAINNAIDKANKAIDFALETSETLIERQGLLRTSIEEIKKYTIEDELNDLISKQELSTKAQDDLKLQLDEANKDLEKRSQWETNFKNFKSFVANQSIKNIQDYTNLFLQKMGSDLSINIDGFATLANGKIKEQISIEVLRGGFNEGSYGAFSGGERGRIDISCILAIQQLINLNCKSGGLDLLICDEILDQVDTLGLESIINSLQHLDRTIMIVSQNEINALKDYTLTIEKRNKISTFAA